MSFIGQLFALGFVAYVSYVVGVQEFGKYASVVSAILIAASICSLAIEFEIPNRSVDERRKLGALGFWITLGMSIVLSLLVVFYLQQLEFFGLVLSACLGMGLSRVVEKQLIAEGRIILVGAMRVCAPALMLVTFGVAIFIGIKCDYEHVLNIYCVSTLVSGVLFYRLKNRFFDVLRSPSELSLLNGVIKVSGYYTLSNFMSSLTYNLPILFVEKYLGPSHAGLLAFVFRTCFSPIATVGSAFASVLHHKFANLKRQQPKLMIALLVRASKILFGLSLLLIGSIYFVYPLIVDLIFGNEWVDAGEYAKALIPMFAAMLVVSPLSVLFYVLSAGRAELINQLMYVFISVLAFGAFAYDPDLALYNVLVIFGAVVALRYVLVFTYLFYRTRKLKEY